MEVVQKPFSNIQMELMKLYSLDIDDSDLLHIKNYLAQYFMQKAIDEADAVWEKKGYSDEMIDELLNKG